MEDKDIPNCPICAFEYSSPGNIPKILPCLHTICSSCIENTIASTPSSEKTSFQCPICRHTVQIPKTGILGFFDNFYISLSCQNHSCAICGATLIRDVECNGPKDTFCNICFQSQNKAQAENDEIRGQESNIKGNIGSCHNFHKSLKTIIEADHLESFNFSNFDLIRKFVSSDKNECWILSDKPFVFKLNYTGQLVVKKYVENAASIQDMGEMSDGSCVLVFTSGKLVMMNHEFEMSELEQVPDFPTALHVSDDSVFIATRPDDSTSNLQNLGRVYVFHCKTKTLEPLQVNEELREVTSMVFNPLSGQIILCDSGRKCVLFVKKFMTLKYTGLEDLPRIEMAENGIEIVSSFRFQPRSVCSDSAGNALIFDAGTNLIHVVNPSATIISVIVTPTMHGSIGALCIDHSGKMWTSDVTAGKVRIFDIDGVHNFHESYSCNKSAYSKEKDEFHGEEFPTKAFRVQCDQTRFSEEFMNFISSHRLDEDTAQNVRRPTRNRRGNRHIATRIGISSLGTDRERLAEMLQKGQLSFKSQSIENHECTIS